MIYIDSNKDLRKCLKMAKILERVGKELFELASNNAGHPFHGRIFDRMASLGNEVGKAAKKVCHPSQEKTFDRMAELGWVAKNAIWNNDDVIEAAEDLVNPLRHEPTEAFSQPHERKAA